MKAFNHR